MNAQGIAASMLGFIQSLIGPVNRFLDIDFTWFYIAQANAAGDRN